MTNKSANYWIFQATPKKYDVNQYLQDIDDYIYWRAQQHRNQIKIGDTVFIWRGNMDGFPRGIIASGIIQEEPTNIPDVKHPEKMREDLWTTPIDPTNMLVGIKLNDIRLTDDDGMITIDDIKNEATINEMTIVTAPRHTNFLLTHDEYEKIIELWKSNNKKFTGYYVNEYDGADDIQIAAIKGRTDIGETTKSQLIKSRRGQGVFKLNVKLNEDKCRVTNIYDPIHLIASHIKPWKDSSDEEKLHGCNGLLLAPHIDHLFDKGLISFGDNGEILVSSALDKKILDAWGVNSDKNVGIFNSEQRDFLDYHRAHVFKK